MPTQQITESRSLAKEYRNITFTNHREAAKIIGDACGKYPERPLNVPPHWKIEIIRGYGLKYTNSQNRDEWVEVIPGDVGSRQEFSETASVIYHKPTKKILKRFGSKSGPDPRELKNVKEFDQKNREHQKVLNDLVEATKDLDPFKRSEEAGRALKNFWISIDDLLLIRKRLGFRDFPDPIIFQQVLLKIQEELLCNCFGTYVSTSQCGAISKHNLNHYDSVRLAFHFDGEKPFVKISLDGDYRKMNGTIGGEEEMDVHLDFPTFLQGNYQWFQSICKAHYPFAKFDYKTVNHPIDEKEKIGQKRNRMIDYRNNKGLGYG